MIVGCYTMDLYCDVKRCKHGQYGLRASAAQFTAQTERGCRAQAESDGWSFKKVAGSAYQTLAICPTCTRKEKL